MAQVDSSIPLGVKPAQFDSPVNAMAKVMQLQGMQQEQQMNALRTQATQRDMDRTNRLYDLMGGGADASALRKAGYLKEANDWEKNTVENDKNRAQTTQYTADAENKTIGMYRDASQAITDPASAAEFVKHMHTDPRLANSAIARVPLEQALSQIPQDPSQLATWKQQFALGATKFMELNKPTTNTVNTGGQTQLVQTPGLGGAPTVAGTFTNTQSPDNAATNATHVQTTRMTQAGEDKRNAATNSTHLLAAGIGPDGQLTSDVAATVKAIGEGRQSPPTLAALRNPRVAAIMDQVNAQYPNFDATQYGARQVAAKSFSTGKDGQAVQSANTALNHLGTLRELAAAQDNGDIRLFNTIANRFATETGGAAPTNLASAVTMVGPEISKAVIGVGGGQGDREKVDAALAALTKGGKGQAAGTLATMEDLFGGRLTEAQRTYERTTGRKDFPTTFLSPAAQKVLASRGGQSSSATTVPPDIAAILQKHGGK